MKVWRRLGGAIVLTACLVPAIPLSSAAAGVPLLTVESPIAGSSTRAVEPTIAGKSNDPTDEVTVEIFAGETPLGEPPLGVPVAALGPMKVSATGDWSAAPHTPLAQGLYTARATQGAFPGAEALTTFTVDNTPPAVSLLPVPTPAASTMPTYGGNAGDAPGDVPSVKVTVYSGSHASGSPAQILRTTTSGSSWSAGPAPALPGGTYTAIAEQADVAGNVGFTEAVTYVLTATEAPPSASLVSIPASPVVGETVSLVSTSLGGSSPIVSFAWDATGSGTFIPAGPVFATKFTSPGAHPVRLIVADAAGLTAVASAKVPVVTAHLKPLLPSPIVRIAGTPYGRYVKIRILSVEAPPGALVTVRCRGRGCPHKSLDRRFAAVSASSARTGLSPLSFRHFQRALRAGVVLQIVVSRPGYMGKYTSYKIRGNAPPARHDACKEPSSARAIPCPPE